MPRSIAPPCHPGQSCLVQSRISSRLLAPSPLSIALGSTPHQFALGVHCCISPHVVRLLLITVLRIMPNRLCSLFRMSWFDDDGPPPPSYAAPPSLKPDVGGKTCAPPSSRKRGTTDSAAGPSHKIGRRPSSSVPSTSSSVPAGPRAVLLTPDVSANLIDQLKARARVQSDVPSVFPVRQGSLTLGSDCSGMGMDYLSLKFLKLPVPVDIAFCSEVDDSKRSILSVMHEVAKVGVMYGDITARDNTDAPPVDIFVSGAPCQAFSAAGKSNGVLESRGLVILHSLAYVVEQLPPVVVFENVAGLLRQKHRPVLKSMSKILARLKYTVSYKLLNTKNHGIPQNRPRVYLIGIRNSSGIPFEWPDHVLPGAATDFLQLDVRDAPLQHMSATAKRNVHTSKKLFAKRWGRKLREVGTAHVADHSLGLRVCPIHAHHLLPNCVARSTGRRTPSSLMRRQAPDFGRQKTWRCHASRSPEEVQTVSTSSHWAAS